MRKEELEELEVNFPRKFSKPSAGARQDTVEKVEEAVDQVGAVSQQGETIGAPAYSSRGLKTTYLEPKWRWISCFCFCCHAVVVEPSFWVFVEWTSKAPALHMKRLKTHVWAAYASCPNMF